MSRSEADHFVFYCHSLGGVILLVVYVDDIIIMGDDDVGIGQLKTHLHSYFQTKDLNRLKYFLGIEVAQSAHGVCISQKKYALNILEEIGMLDSQSIDIPLDPNAKFVLGQGEPLENPW